MSTGQLIVTIAFVGLLGALHLALRAAREPAGTAVLAAPAAALRRFPITPVLVVAAFAALAVAGAAFIVSIVDDEETSAPTTRERTAPRTTAPPAPPPPQPPPPAPPPFQAPAGTTSVARVVTDSNGSLAVGRNRVGGRPKVLKRETGVYAIEVPGLSVQLRRAAAVRVRAAEAGTHVTARKNGPKAEFVVFTRDQTGRFADRAFEVAIFLPKQQLEGTAGEEDDGRPQLPPTR